jgi:hypothetical protein
MFVWNYNNQNQLWKTIQNQSVKKKKKPKGFNKNRKNKLEHGI